MADTSDIDELLVVWEEAFEQGEDVSAAELCKHAPHLIPELERRIAALKAMQWMNEPAGDYEEKTSSESLAANTKLGRYLLISQLGEGGFGKVWKAYDPHLDRHVAVKVPHRHRAAAGQMDAFLAEARRVASLRSPGIVPVFDVGQQNGNWFIVSELIDGTDLARKLASGPLPSQEAVRIALQIAEALQVAHDQGFVHRDIKPSNILLTRDGQAYLTDFGITVAINAWGDHDPLVGTLPYMAPEQLSETPAPPDPRADIYSLGVVLYESLAGRLPFTANNLSELRTLIVSGNLPPLRNANPTIPQALERLCLKALSKSPSERFSTAAVFSAALRQAIGQRSRIYFQTASAAALLAGVSILGYLSFAESQKPPIKNSPSPPTNLENFQRQIPMPAHPPQLPPEVENAVRKAQGIRQQTRERVRTMENMLNRKFVFQIQTQEGERIDNVTIEAQYLEAAKTKLMKQYPNCQILKSEE